MSNYDRRDRQDETAMWDAEEVRRQESAQQNHRRSGGRKRRNSRTGMVIYLVCVVLGSDLNVCLEGGSILATSRGEVIKKLKPVKSKLTLIKPKNLGISAREAYTKYSNKTIKPRNNMAEKMLDAIDKNDDFSKYLYNDLEYAVFDDYKELQKIKQCIPNAVMSGSGSTYFVLEEEVSTDKLGPDFQIIKGLEFIEEGVGILQCNNFVTN